ncbi:hypothetical protein DFA_07515 [Cavenderia fasciculata]|uniref:CMP/dCMP-type deaminase domain-containing protein n=1 Tax=Cavenderia fasciculata TaxID=261658 RepID=F4PWM7_CACFS|nr:uncharacterized protein DFA_07515 [Cavenderia fasciculata]EGG20391.1 hypothetical protein DFA_07515 [Cavenderia fasciculata]|eukprot:XP_004367374.1 hypothetical protein DFA_07515 [Cavenderia fasciculata]
MRFSLSLLFVILSVLLAGVLACKDPYNPETVDYGQCASATKANYEVRSDSKVLTPADLPADELAVHESRMRHIIDIARVNNKKFVSSIYFPNGTLACIGINTGKPNMIAHGEIVAIQNCTEIHGISMYTNYSIYTTGEPCSMCASAILWSRFKTVVWSTYNSDLYCKICMSNIPIDSSYIFSRAYGLGIEAPVAIGGVVKAEGDAWFGTYCNRPTSIYYIAPKCACQDPAKVSPLKFTQTRTTVWVEGGDKVVTQWNAIISNPSNSTIVDPPIVISPSVVFKGAPWGISAASEPNTYKLSYNKVLFPGQTFSFGYSVYGLEEVAFTALEA